MNALYIPVTLKGNYSGGCDDDGDRSDVVVVVIVDGRELVGKEVKKRCLVLDGRGGVGRGGGECRLGRNFNG